MACSVSRGYHLVIPAGVEDLPPGLVQAVQNTKTIACTTEEVRLVSLSCVPNVGDLECISYTIAKVMSSRLSPQTEHLGRSLTTKSTLSSTRSPERPQKTLSNPSYKFRFVLAHVNVCILTRAVHSTILRVFRRLLLPSITSHFWCQERAYPNHEVLVSVKPILLASTGFKYLRL